MLDVGNGGIHAELIDDVDLKDRQKIQQAEGENDEEASNLDAQVKFLASHAFQVSNSNDHDDTSKASKRFFNFVFPSSLKHALTYVQNSDLYSTYFINRQTFNRNW